MARRLIRNALILSPAAAEITALSDLVWATGPDAVQHVMVNGEWVVRNGALTRVDETERRAAIAAELRRENVRA